MKKAIFISLSALVLIAGCKNNEREKEKTGDHTQHISASTQARYADSLNAGLIREDTLKGSPARTAMAFVKDNHVHIEYNSPGVKGRIIWGGLVAYGQVWVTGAHHATRISFSKDVEIAGKQIPKGTYALFTIPGQEEWTVILNKNYEQHLADDYSEKEDMVRVNVKPEAHKPTPRLTYVIAPLANDNGEVQVLWEKLSVRFSFKNK